MLDKEETERLYRQQAEKMHQLATTLLHDEEEAHDAVSEIFERLSDFLQRSQMPICSSACETSVWTRSENCRSENGFRVI